MNWQHSSGKARQRHGSKNSAVWKNYSKFSKPSVPAHMTLKEKYNKVDTTSNHLEQLTSQLLEAKFDAETKYRFREALSKDHGIRRPTKTIKLNKKWPLLLTVAASFLLLVYVGILFLNPTPSSLQLAESYLIQPFPGAENRSGEGDILELRLAANAAYDAGDFEKSATLRAQLNASDQATVDDPFYLGLSQLYQVPPKLEEAISQFQSITDIKEHKWNDEANWYLALTLIKANKTQDAKEVLQAIVSDDGWNSSKATALLESMD